MKSISLISLLCIAVGTGCGTDTIGRVHDGGMNGNADLAFNFGDGSVQTTCDDQHPCPSGQRCYNSMCIPDNGTCTTDNDCENDTYCVCTQGGGMDMGACMGGICVPWGDPPNGLFDPSCQGQAFSASQFVAPKVKCQWGKGDQSSGTLSVPIVADLDGDKKPEIVFMSYPSRFTAIHGADCSVYFDKQFNFDGSNQSQLAVADLDADGVPEIIGMSSAHQVVVFDNKGNLLATAPTAYSESSAGWGGPAIADVDGVAPPEIIAAAQVSRYVKGQGIQVLWTKTTSLPTIGSLTIAADLDGDGKAEVITGKNVYDGTTGADKTPSALANLSGAAPYPATGDFNKDGKPDLVLVQNNGNEIVSVFDYANNKFIFGPFTLPSTSGGPPTVADFDGDKVPDFGTAGTSNYYVFAMKCAQSPKPADCDQTSNLGILWKKNTQDKSSGVTASSVFDFNGDGKAEVVYRDECWLRVYNGPDGKTVFASNITSATAHELPVIADVDNDQHADIVVSSDEYVGSLCPTTPDADTGTPWTGLTTGIFVLQDPMNRWMPSRGVWNQHAYHITNINDDLTVPTNEQPNWKTWNNYRQNVQGVAGMPAPQEDSTGAYSTGIDTGQGDCTTQWTLRAQICNRGTAPAPAGLPGTFYASDPRLGNATPICTGKTTMDLAPGSCETVECNWANPPQMPVDLWFRANDDGKGMPQTECKDGNDLLIMKQVACSSIG